MLQVRDAVREMAVALQRQYLVRVWKMDIGEGTTISLTAKLDKTNPRGIHIGRYSAGIGRHAATRAICPGFE